MKKEAGRVFTNKDGQYHREDGPAISNSKGLELWYFDGKRHRKGGPAIIYENGHSEWYQDGLLHRTDGPAVCHKHITEYYLFGIQIPKETYWINVEILENLNLLNYSFKELGLQQEETVVLITTGS